MNDKEIIEGVKKSDVNAELALYNKYKKDCMNYLNKITKSKSSIEDIYHESFIVVLEQILENKREITVSLKTYLISVCRRQELKRFKKDKNTIYPEDQENLSGSILSDSREDSDRLQNEEQLESFFIDAYMNLKKNNRKCYDLIKLHHLEGQSMAVIYDLLGYKNADSTKAQLWRCLEKLRQLIPQFYNLK